MVRTQQQHVRSVTFDGERMSMYIDLRARSDDTHGAVLQGFRRHEDGSMAKAEREGQLRLGDALVSANGVDVSDRLFLDVIKLLASTAWPLTLEFCPEAELESWQQRQQQEQEQQEGRAPSLPSHAQQPVVQDMATFCAADLTEKSANLPPLPPPPHSAAAAAEEEATAATAAGIETQIVPAHPSAGAEAAEPSAAEATEEPETGTAASGGSTKRLGTRLRQRAVSGVRAARAASAYSASVAAASVSQGRNRAGKAAGKAWRGLGDGLSGSLSGLAGLRKRVNLHPAGLGGGTSSSSRGGGGAGLAAGSSLSPSDRARLEQVVSLVRAMRLVPASQLQRGTDGTDAAVSWAHDGGPRSQPSAQVQAQLHSEMVCAVFGDSASAASAPHTLDATNLSLGAASETGLPDHDGSGADGELDLRRHVQLKWFRTTSGGRCVEIAGASDGFYQPSVNDIGESICVQCTLTDDPSIVNFVEYGPLIADAAIVSRAQDMLRVRGGDSGGSGVGDSIAGDVRSGERPTGVHFAVTHRDCPDLSHVLVAGECTLQLWRGTPGGDQTHTVGSNSGLTSDSNSALLWSVEYHTTMLLLLDPCSPCFLHLVYTANARCAHLAVETARDRDVLALVVRELRDSAIGADGALAAAMAEREVSLEQLESEELAAGDGECDDVEGSASGQRAKSPSPDAENWAGNWDDDGADDDDVHHVAGRSRHEHNRSEGNVIAPLTSPNLPEDGSSDASLEAQLADARHEAARQAADLKAAQQRLRALAGKWDASERVRQRAVAELGRATSERSSLRRRAEEHAAELAQAQDALASAQHTVQTQEVELLETQAELRSTRHELLEVVEALQATQARLAEAQRETESARAAAAFAEAGAAAAAINQASATTISSDSAAEITSTPRNPAPPATADEVEAVADVVAAELDDASRRAMEEVEALRAELSQRRAATQLAEATMRSELQQLRGSLEAAKRGASEQVAAALRAKADTEVELEARRADAAKAEARQHEAVQLQLHEKARADVLETRVGQLEVELAAAKADRREAEASIERERAAAARDARGEAEANASVELAEAERMVSVAEQQLEQANVERRGLRRRLDSLAKDLQRLGGPELIEKQLRERRSLQVELAESHARRREERRLAQAELAQYRATLEEAAHELRKSGTEIILERASASVRSLVASVGSGGSPFSGGAGSPVRRGSASSSGARERADSRALRVLVLVGRDSYTVMCDAGHPVSWLLSEVMRRKIQTVGDANADLGICGLERTAEGKTRVLDLAANIGACIVDGDTLRARMA